MASSPLDAHLSALYRWIGEYKNNNEIVALLNEEHNIATSEASVRRCIERNESLHEAAEKRRLYQEVVQSAEAPGVEQDGDQVIITDKARLEEIPVEGLKIEDILRRRNLDPDEWEVKNLLDNQWNANAGSGTKITLYQFKVWLTRKVPIAVIYPAWPEPARFFAPKPVDDTKPLVTVVATDPQCPFILPELDELVQQFLHKVRPDKGILAGDLMNLSYIGRHRDNPQWDDHVAAAVQSSFDMLYNWREANEDTEWTLIKGNHDDRIRNEQLERNERLYGVSAAQWPGDEPEEWVYSLNHLLHLKRLGVNYHEPEGTYEFEQVPITEFVAARHGHKVVKDGPLKTAEELGHSIVLGHTHRQSVARKTKWNSMLKRWHVVTAIEAGCLCEIVGGLGYANGGCPDWQPGFATITSWPDGQFTYDHAIYTQNGELFWRDKRFSL